MATQQAHQQVKQTIRAAWARGDYHAFAKATIWERGAELVDACRIGPGQRVLDVAAGTGNTAIRAATRGAQVVASDLTPENFAAGRREAAAHGVELEWVEADAEALPFGDGEFDVVTSSFGAIFAPDHRAVAGEMLRVCRPGGTVGLLTFTPAGLFGRFLEVLGPYMPPPPPGGLSPALWGEEGHLRELLSGGVASLETARREYTETAPTPRDYVELFKRCFGPVVAAYEALAGDPHRLAAFDRDFLDFATSANVAPPGEPAQYPYEYLLVLAERRGAQPAG